MGKKLSLLGLLLAVVDEQGPRPKIWYPNFASLAHIHNSAVKSFSIMIGDRSYRERPLTELTCFGLLPFKDINAVGLIHFFGIQDKNRKEGVRPEMPTTITLLFPEGQYNDVCQSSPQIHRFLERENKMFLPFIQNDDADSQQLANIYNAVKKYLETL